VCVVNEHKKMKKQILIILGLLLLTLISCDPPYSDLRPAGTMYLKGTFDNTSESIDLGDTLTFIPEFFLSKFFNYFAVHSEIQGLFIKNS
jgi:type 1 fimbria pilin